MNLKNYIKKIRLSIYLVIFIIITVNINIILDIRLEEALSSLVYIDTMILIMCTLFFILGYRSYIKDYKRLFDYINNNKNCKFKNDKLKEVIDRNLLENEKVVESLRKEIEEINDYMTKWIHEIKIPIAVLEIINQRIREIESSTLNSFDLHKQINIELKRIDNLVQQALYISKCGDYSSSFLIEEINLDKLVKEIIKKNKYLFIYNSIELKIGNLNKNILSDKKWIMHIIEQIINNSCKYIKENGIVEIYIQNEDNAIELHIKDNGIGIKKEDINRVFDKGYVGKHKEITKSTGMGLYISKKMLNKLSHDITIESKENEFCDVCITFYNLSDYFNVT
ncbi:sensor histidine kinase [Paraclostridium ghonii]|uniref:sensor histidine kinase n=1 Tax=Paraclostridium ghonii TaxID=29358 RepID=UPI00202CF22A|nr:sensor histidine kinase [Paeniclostridium ghonii]MCM0168018.1 sensor histidine kinase [Paeniclostridium ghonii]